MGKIKMNGKEIEFDEKNLKPLSDEELESATGGLVVPSEGYIVVFRYVCDQCGATGPWYTKEDSRNPEVRNIKHNNPTCQGSLKNDPYDPHVIRFI